MNEKWKSYLILSIGLIGALLFLFVKIGLYQNLEYESDLFSILQLSRDYLLGKPFMYENAYGNNAAIHNYYLIPIFSSFTYFLGGKGLFVGGFLLMCWALFLLKDILKNMPWGKSIFYLIMFFSPTAFFMWDNFHFGWHAESFFYPLCVIFISALILNKKWHVALSAIFLIINREDGIVLLISIYIIYTAAKNIGNPIIIIQKLWPKLIYGNIIFLCGLLILQLFSNGESRVGVTAQRLIDNFNSNALAYYLSDQFKNWFLLCGLVWFSALLYMRKSAFIFWSFIALLPILIVNFYSAAYYFPDPKYGINWAPRLAGTFGFMMAMLLVSLTFGKPKIQTENNTPIKPIFNYFLVGLALLICYIQFVCLQHIHYYPHYSIYGRIQLAFFEESRKETDLETFNSLQRLSNIIPKNYPVRLDWHLFAMFDHTDLIWPNTGRKPYHAAKLLIISGDTPHEEPIPIGFEIISQIGKYEIWSHPDNIEIRRLLND